MYRVILASMLLLMCAPALTVAQAPADSKPSAAPVSVADDYIMSMSGWQRFVSIFSVALLVIIVIQLMLLRADLSAMLERQVPPGGMSR